MILKVLKNLIKKNLFSYFKKIARVKQQLIIFKNKIRKIKMKNKYMIIKIKIISIL